MNNGKELYLRLLKYVESYKKKFLVAIFGMVIFAATEPALPALMKPMLDGSFIEKNEQMMLLIPILLILIYIIRGTATFITAVALNWISYTVITELRIEMFQRLITLPNSYYDNHPTGTTISKLTYDVNQVGQAATEVLIILVRDSLAIIGLVSWMLYLDWQLSLLVFITAPIIILIVRSVSIRLRSINHSLQDQMGILTQILEESISGQRIIKIFNGSQYETNRIKDITTQIRLFNMKNIVTTNITSPIVQIVSVSALSAVVYIASIQSANNQITAGEFISFFAAMAMLMTPVKRITGVNAILQRGLAASDSVFNLIDQKPEKDPALPIILEQYPILETMPPY